MAVYDELLDNVIRPDKSLVKNYHTVKHAIKKVLKKNYKPCQLGLIPEVDFAIGLEGGKLPCHMCPRYNKEKYKCSVT